MQKFFNNFFASEPFILHDTCYLWKPEMVWLHILSDSLITIAYYSIPISLVYFVHKRRVIPFQSQLLMFGAFSVACGTTHILNIWMLWYPVSWLSGCFKAIAAIVSLYTAWKLISLIPQALALSSPAQGKKAKQAQEAWGDRDRVNGVAPLALAKRDAVASKELAVASLRPQPRLPLGDATGKGKRASALLDVSVGKAATEELVERSCVELPRLTQSTDSQQHLVEDITANLPASIYRAVMHRDGTLTLPFISDGLEEITGINPDEAIAHPERWREMIHPDDRAQFQEWVRNSCESRQPCHHECRIIAKSGQVKWIQDSARFHADNNGNVVVDGVTLDITARKQAEAALREKEEHYRSVVTAMAEGIVFQEANGVIRACNHAAERILGLSAKEIIGRTWIDQRWRFINEDGSPCVDETNPISIALRTGKAFIKVVQGIQKLDGTLTWISASSQPLFRGNETKPYAAVVSFRDITDRKQVEAALRQMLQQERLLGMMRDRIRQSLNLEEILNTTALEVRQFLQTDRVIIYRFDSDSSGAVAVESVSQEGLPLLGTSLKDPLFAQPWLETYKNNPTQRIKAVCPIDLTQSYSDLIEGIELSSFLVVPIIFSSQLSPLSSGQKAVFSEAKAQDFLWGLLVAQHCTAPRQWQQWEVELLESLAIQLAIAIQQAQLYQQLGEANLELSRLAAIDGLTQLANRRRFDEYFDKEWRRLAREQAPLSLILCDIDCFKLYNDTYGHPAGDICLQQVAGAIRGAVRRPADLVARYGGEEFAVILPNTTTAGALRVAQTIRDRLRQLKIPHVGSLVSQYVTLSMGIASIIPTPDTFPTELISAADEALYHAKAAGRDTWYAHP
jgi:diguanylate cyclase (GGDEF)-like protein/PAS domain S-box-containing protein